VGSSNVVRALVPLLVGMAFFACGGASNRGGDDGPASGGGAAAATGGSGMSGATGGASGANGGTNAGGGGGGGSDAGGTGASGGSDAGGGASGAAGSGSMGPCRGLACDQTTCTMGSCTQMPCASGTSTTVSGAVYDPAGKTPLYNVVVYVPDGPVPPFPDGASCARCGESEPNSITSTLTGADGRFVLPDVPVGGNIPLVIQIGKWRRQTTIPDVRRCVDTRLTDIEQMSLPSKKSEGDIPLIAITTGGGDSMECLPRRMGIEDAEFTTDTGDGRVHLYAGTDSGMSIATKSFDSGTAFTHSDNLWSGLDALRRYDIVILSCEGDSNENPRPSGSRQAVFDYTAIGGRLFASHWHHRWISAGPAPLPDVGTFADRDNPDTPTTATVNMAFPKGQALAEWLVNVGASTTRGEMEVIESRDNVQAVNPMYATEWMRVVNVNEASTPSIQYFSFDTPLTVEASLQCGRVAFTDLHVSNTTDAAQTSDSPGDPFPAHCQVRDLTAQEKSVGFMLFDLSSCL